MVTTYNVAKALGLGTFNNYSSYNNSLGTYRYNYDRHSGWSAMHAYQTYLQREQWLKPS